MPPIFRGRHFKVSSAFSKLLGYCYTGQWNGTYTRVCVLSHFSHVTLWTVACQAPLSMGIVIILGWKYLVVNLHSDIH